MSGGGNQQRQTGTANTRQNRKPVPYADRHYRRGLKDANRLYKKGVGFNAYPGATYAPLNAQQTRAAGQIENIAGDKRLSNAMTNTALGMIRGDGLSRDVRNNMGPLKDIASGKLQITTGGDLQNLANSFKGPSYAETYLKDTAEGKFLNANPYIDQVAANVARDISEANALRYQGAGRFGSNDMHEDIAESTGDAVNDLRFSNYTMERNNMMQAPGLMDSGKLQYGGMRGNALGQLSEVQGANISNRAGAATGLLNQYQQGLDRQLAWGALTPTVDNMRYAGADRLMGVGDMYQANSQGQINANVAQYNTQQQAPWNRLNAYGGFVAGSPANQFGTTSGTTTSYVPNNPYMNAFGGAMGGATMGAMTGLPYGAPIGGLLGGAAGYFG
jgi:hypothetical protein